MRHTAALPMFDAGLTISEVQPRLGHHSQVLTQEVYTHLMRERRCESALHDAGVGVRGCCADRGGRSGMCSVLRRPCA
jgi:hypothetical protein